MGIPDYKDIDYILFTNQWGALEDELIRSGYKMNDVADDVYVGSFASLRREKINLIVLFNEDEFKSFLAAFMLCNLYRVVDKGHRCVIHNAIRSGVVNASFTVDKSTGEMVMSNVYEWHLEGASDF